MRYFSKKIVLKPFISFMCLAGGFAAGNVSAATSATYPVGAEPKAVAVADFNNDGKKDLASVNRGSSTVSILLGDGAGNFGAAMNFSAGASSEPFGLAVGDFNNDGKTDLVVSKPSLHLVSLLTGDGGGGLGAPVNFSVGENPFTLAVGDFNGDGKNDLAVADGGFNDGGVYILLGTGTGSFGSPTKFTAGVRPRYVAVADFNQDNKSDLAVANVGFNFNKISILLGNGAGGFSAPSDFAVGSSPIGLVVRDFNKDNFNDIAVANTDSHNVSILKGNGQGGFDAATNFPAGSSPLSITSGDFDGDGKLDLAVGENNSSNRISILRGDDTGQFTSPASFSAGTGPYDVAAGDFTGTGAGGLAIANANSNNLTVLIGPLPSLSIAASASVVEGNSGKVSASFPLTLSGSINQPVTIFYTLTNGTAFGGSDFDNITTPVVIPAHAMTGSVSVLVNGDPTPELDETFIVDIANTLNAFVVRAQAIGTIVDDEPATLMVNESQRAIALDSVTLLRDPFAVVNLINFSSDARSRIILFAVDLDFVAGDVVTVQAEDAQHVNHQLPVEFVGAVPNFSGLSQLVVKLPDNLSSGNFMVSFTWRGVTSNKGVITIKP